MFDKSYSHHFKTQHDGFSTRQIPSCYINLGSVGYPRVRGTDVVYCEALCVGHFGVHPLFGDKAGVGTARITLAVLHTAGGEGVKIGGYLVLSSVITLCTRYII